MRMECQIKRRGRRRGCCSHFTQCIFSLVAFPPSINCTSRPCLRPSPLLPLPPLSFRCLPHPLRHCVRTPARNPFCIANCLLGRTDTSEGAKHKKLAVSTCFSHWSAGVQVSGCTAFTGRGRHSPPSACELSMHVRTALPAESTVAYESLPTVAA